MRFLSILALVALPTAALAKDKKAETTFSKYFSQSLSATPIKLEDSSFNELTASPRDYAAIVLLTAMPAQFGCQLCRQFQPEWDVLSKSWNRGDRKGNSRVIFGTLDFPDGKGTFQKMMLQTAPVLMMFPPSTGPSNGQPIRLDFTQGPQSAEQVHAWISRHLPDGPKPPLIRPFNWTRFATFTTLLLGGISIVSISGPYLLPLLQNRNLWAAISLIIVLLFTSGHMFNHIRKVPYVSGNGKGGISYFASGFSNQYGMETQIVAAIYGILSFATIALALKVPRIAEPKKQQVAVVVWGCVMFGMYSFLLNVFKVKNGGYPFRLPPF